MLTVATLCMMMQTLDKSVVHRVPYERVARYSRQERRQLISCARRAGLRWVIVRG